jgi:hypothetical protein
LKPRQVAGIAAEIVYAAFEMGEMSQGAQREHR